jgi:hypothetical protein
MTEPVFISIKLLFILGFTLHNMEEAVWFPKWSVNAKKYLRPVSSNEFIFAGIVLTVFGYILTALNLLFNNHGNILNYIYIGFVGMIGLNSLFPHLITTILIKKYSPGLITGICLNLPLSIIITAEYLNTSTNLYKLIISIIIVSGAILLSLKNLFKLGKYLFNC